MWDSLLKLRALPDDITLLLRPRIYARRTSSSRSTIEPDNPALKARAEEVTQLRAAGKPTLPVARRRESGQSCSCAPMMPSVAAAVAHEGQPTRARSVRRARASARTSSDDPSPQPPTSSARLELQPHPEGGHYRETFRDSARRQRPRGSTAIYFLLARGERSHWHRIDAVEIWHYYAGAPLTLRDRDDSGHSAAVTLGADLAAGEAAAGDRAGTCLAGSREHSATGRWSAARWRRASNSRHSNWRRRAGRRVFRGWVKRSVIPSSNASLQ